MFETKLLLGGGPFQAVLNFDSLCTYIRMCTIWCTLSVVLCIFNVLGHCVFINQWHMVLSPMMCICNSTYNTARCSRCARKNATGPNGSLWYTGIWWHNLMLDCVMREAVYGCYVSGPSSIKTVAATLTVIATLYTQLLACCTCVVLHEQGRCEYCTHNCVLTCRGRDGHGKWACLFIWSQKCLVNVSIEGGLLWSAFCMSEDYVVLHMRGLVLWL